MNPITVCFVHFCSLTLANMDAALFSLKRQNLSSVEEIVVIDNNTEEDVTRLRALLDLYEFPCRVRLLPFRHGDPMKTHSWSTNVAVHEAQTPWVLFTRSDYILDFDVIRRFFSIVLDHGLQWNGFVTANVYHLNPTVEQCEAAGWRKFGAYVLGTLPGAEADHTEIDAGVWMLQRHAFNAVGGLDENLTAWGHAQTHFQHKLFEYGTEFVRIKSPLFFHPQHAAPRDLAVAHEQLRATGGNLRLMWNRYHGSKPY